MACFWRAFFYWVYLKYLIVLEQILGCRRLNSEVKCELSKLCKPHNEKYNLLMKILT